MRRSGSTGTSTFAILATCEAHAPAAFTTTPVATGHGTVGVDKTIAGAEASPDNIVSPKLGIKTLDLRKRQHADILQPVRLLPLLVGLQIVQVLLTGGQKQIPLRS